MIEQTYATDTITLALSGNADNYWYYIESVDSQNQIWTRNMIRTLTDGVYTLHAYGNDSVGNIGYDSVKFTIKTTVPTTGPTTTTLLPRELSHLVGMFYFCYSLSLF